MSIIYRLTLAVSAIVISCLYVGLDGQSHARDRDWMENRTQYGFVASASLKKRADKRVSTQNRLEKNRQRIKDMQAKWLERYKARLEARKQSKKAGKKPLKASKQITKSNTAAPKGKYGQLIAKYAAQHGVPYSLARAVVQVESSFRPNVTGGAGEIGLMQIKYATARGMGYKGSRKALYNPATNLYWGMKYLGKAHKLSGGTTCGTILKYNAGHGAKRMNPVSANYCKKVRRFMV